MSNFWCVWCGATGFPTDQAGLDHEMNCTKADQKRIEQERHINEADTRPLGGLPPSPKEPVKEESFLIPLIVTVRSDKVIGVTKASSLILEALNDLRAKGEIVRYQTSVTQVINRGQDVA